MTDEKPCYECQPGSPCAAHDDSRYERDEPDYATDAECDGAAADMVYGKEPW
jgi:hypothetical protein